MAVNIKGASPPVFVEHLFFKTYPEVILTKPEGGLLDRHTQSLECSNKFGALIVAGQQSVLILRAEDVLSAQITAAGNHKKHANLSDIPHISVQNSAFGTPPIVIAISNGEKFIALDTLKNGVSFVLIFKLEQFILQAGNLQPYFEVRASTQEGSRVSGISWNPGENMNNMLAINCDDGTLQLATIGGEKSVEMCMYSNGGVKSMCWSPKGKQLVVGKMNGTLSQLKLDLAEAKQIPGAGGARVPSTIFWSSTTQFLVNLVVDERDIDFVQLDLIKGAPPSYSNFGDIFISDKISSNSKCHFVPILPWNVILCSSNTINDVVLLAKGLEGNENWTVADINDNRRAAIPIDNFAVGAALFTGYEPPIIFSESETFGSMPVLFILSDAGALCSVSLVNSNSNAPSIFKKVTNPLPSQIFSQMNQKLPDLQPSSVPQQQPIAQIPPPMSIPTAQQQPQLSTGMFAPTAASQQPQSNNLFGFSPTPTVSFGQSPQIQTPKPAQTPTLFKLLSTTQASSQPPTQPSTLLSTHQSATIASNTTNALNSGVSPSVSFGKFQPPVNSQSFLTAGSLSSGLPTLPQVEDLKRIVEEKRAQTGLLAVDDEKEDYDAIALELEKFHRRLVLFKKNQGDLLVKTQTRLAEICKRFEDEVLTRLNIMENFVAAVEETTISQKDEITGLKNKVLSYFTQLEYAKSLAERNKDPKYIQLLRAQQMDPGTEHKFQETQKLYHYVKNQLAECDRFFKIQNREPNPLQGAAAIQVIYQTLSNHSKVIKRLAQDLNGMRAQIGLRKSSTVDEHMEVFQLPSMGYGYYEKRPVKSRSSHSSAVVPKIRTERITVDDLTAGVSRLKFNRCNDLYLLPSRKPLKISAKKLNVVTKSVSKTVDIEVTSEETGEDWEDIKKKQSQSRKLISKLDDKIMPPMSNRLNINEQVVTSKVTTTPKPVPVVVSQSTAPISIIPNKGLSTSALSGSGDSAKTVTFKGFGSNSADIIAKPNPTSGFTSSWGGDAPKLPTMPLQQFSMPAVTTTSAPTSSFSFSNSSFTDGLKLSSGPPSSSESIKNLTTVKPAFSAELATSTAPSWLADSQKTLSTPQQQQEQIAPTLTASTTSPFGESIFGGVKSVPTFGSGTLAFGTPPKLNEEDVASKLTAKPAASQQPTLIISTNKPLSVLSESGDSNKTVTFKGFASSDIDLAGFTVRSDGDAPKLSTMLATNTTTAASTGVASTFSFSSSSFGDGLKFSTPALSPLTSLQTSVASTGLTTFESTKADAKQPTSEAPNWLTDKTLSTPSQQQSTPTSVVNPVSSITSPFGGSIFGGVKSPLATTTTQSQLFSIPATTNTTTATSAASAFSFSSSSFTEGLKFSPTTIPPQTNLPTSTTAAGTTGLFTSGPTISDTANILTPVIKPTTSTEPVTSTAASSWLTPDAQKTPQQQPSVPTSTSITSPFGGSIFGGGIKQQGTPGFGTIAQTPPTTQATSPLFGGGSVFGGGGTTSSVFGSAFGTPTTSATISTPIFGGAAAQPSTPSSFSTLGGGQASASTTGFGSGTVFGGTTAFGSPSAFGSTTTPASTAASSPFGGTSLFGGGGGVVKQSTTTFGGIAQTAPTTQSTFGGGAIFGGGTSAFGSSTFGASPASGSSSSPFGGNVFGGGASAQSSTPSFGTMGQQAQSSGFGSGPVFGGSAAFGSSSSAFGSSPSSAGGSTTSPFGGGGSIFGGGAVQQGAPSFGALAQSAPQQGFGSFGSQSQPPQAASPFGGGQQQQQSPAFGQPQQQQQASFGGSAFSSWR